MEEENLYVKRVYKDKHAALFHISAKPTQ